jgi:hypothetical protein
MAMSGSIQKQVKVGETLELIDPFTKVKSYAKITAGPPTLKNRNKTDLIN